MDKIFSPASVALVGASNNIGKVGYQIMDNLVKFSFSGLIYPVNPKSSEVLGVKAWKNIREIPTDVDLVIFAIPAKFIPSQIQFCAEKNVKGIVVISAGFKETGNALLEQELITIAKKLNIPIIGPNCLGIINPWSNLNASFANRMPDKGSIGFFSQSGALCTTILDWAAGNNLGFSKFISIGNKADLTETDFIKYLADDDQTKVILGYIEGITDGAKFIKEARRATKKKPVILIKSGGTSAGAKAASSHTGTLAGSDNAYDAAFKQSGIIRAESINEMFSLGRVFAYQPLPKGDRLTIITNAGGCGIIAADACEKNNIQLLPLSKESIQKLHDVLPPSSGFYNPIDILGDAMWDRYAFTLQTALEDEQNDGIMVILTPQGMTDVDVIAKGIGEKCTNATKPVISAFMGDVSIREGEKLLNQHNIPNYRFPEDAVASFKGMIQYDKWQKKELGTIEKLESNSNIVKKVIAYSRNYNRQKLGEKSARELLEGYGFCFPVNHISATAEEAVKSAKKIGFPIVMKIASPDILHKTDIGGVRVGLSTPEEVEKAFMEVTTSAILHYPGAVIWGVAIQEMISGGKEMILGMNRDLQFGPMIMFGMGGVYVELLKDISFRIAPLTKLDAMEMIKETKAYSLLSGLRGDEPSDIDAVVDAICRLSQLACEFPEILELDINPLTVLKKGEGVLALDARLQLSEENQEQLS